MRIIHYINTYHANLFQWQYVASTEREKIINLKYCLLYHCVHAHNAHFRENCSILLSWASLDYPTIKEQRIREDACTQHSCTHTHVYIRKCASFPSNSRLSVRIPSKYQDAIFVGRNLHTTIQRQRPFARLLCVCMYAYKHICFMRPD